MEFVEISSLEWNGMEWNGKRMEWNGHSFALGAKLIIAYAENKSHVTLSVCPAP
jgi:hypothetical protein